MKKHCARLIGTSLSLDKTILCIPSSISSQEMSCDYYVPNPVSPKDEENHFAEEYQCQYGWFHVLVTECTNAEVRDEVKLNMKLEEI